MTADTSPMGEVGNEDVSRRSATRSTDSRLVRVLKHPATFNRRSATRSTDSDLIRALKHPAAFDDRFATVQTACKQRTAAGIGRVWGRDALARGLGGPLDFAAHPAAFGLVHLGPIDRRIVLEALVVVIARGP